MSQRLPHSGDAGKLGDTNDEELVEPVETMGRNINAGSEVKGGQDRRGGKAPDARDAYLLPGLRWAGVLQCPTRYALHRLSFTSCSLAGLTRIRLPVQKQRNFMLDACEADRTAP